MNLCSEAREATMHAPPMLDVVFPVCGSWIPTDHHYPLYSCLSRMFPWLHDPGVPCAVAPITGQYTGRGQLRIEPGASHLRLRLHGADIRRALPLAGKAIAVGGQRVRLGVPHVEALQPVSD